MSMIKKPEEFPLESIDSKGQRVKEGDKVKILTIPDWLIQDLDEVSVAAIKNCEGTEMLAYEIDDHGYVWVETITIETSNVHESHRFTMEPKNLLKI